MSIARRNRASEQAERRRCPKCGRKSALSTVVHEGQVVSYCRWDDCDYEKATETIAAEAVDWANVTRECCDTTYNCHHLNDCPEKLERRPY